MENSSLAPPNSHRLSDCVVRSVMQRTSPIGRSRGACQRSSSAPNANEAATFDRLLPTGEKRKKYEPTIFPNRKHLQTVASDDGKCQPSAESASSNEQQPQIIELLMLGKSIERRRRRDNQRRYRKKQEDWRVSLEEETYKLREEIDLLQRHRHDIPTKTTVWDVVIEYFRHFRQGLQLEWQFSTTSDFLRRTMAPDVVYNVGQGPRTILSSWYYLGWFNDVEVELEGLRRGARGSLIATTTTSFTITQRSLREVFPHIYTSDATEPALLSPLEMKLLGHRIVMRGSSGIAHTISWSV